MYHGVLKIQPISLFYIKNYELKNSEFDRKITTKDTEAHSSQYHVYLNNSYHVL